MMGQMPTTQNSTAPVAQPKPVALPSATTNAQFAPPPGPVMARDNSMRAMFAAPQQPTPQAPPPVPRAGKIPTTGGNK